MAESSYKWRLEITLNHGEISHRLIPLAGSQNLPGVYIHRPGDINYADLKLLSVKLKQELLFRVATEQYDWESDDRDTMSAIAEMICTDRDKDRNFLPEELNPANWKPVLFASES